MVTALAPSEAIRAALKVKAFHPILTVFLFIIIILYFIFFELHNDLERTCISCYRTIFANVHVQFDFFAIQLRNYK